MLCDIGHVTCKAISPKFWQIIKRLDVIESGNVIYNANRLLTSETGKSFHIHAFIMSEQVGHWLSMQIFLFGKTGWRTCARQPVE
jgi:hypothetical protein